MPEQWELVADDSREADQIKTFIIFCEDQVSEPYYFSSFEKPEKLKINSIPNQRQGKLNLDSTIAHCQQDGLITFEEGGYKVKGERPEHIWCVYDRDMEHLDPEQVRPADNIAFDTAIQTAVGAGLKVAWSNDAFELWVLLHFEKVPTNGVIHRTYLYERLTTIFKGLHPDDATFQAIVGNQNFNYKHIMKKRQSFIEYVLPVLHKNMEYAIQNASELDAIFNANVPFHLRNPNTKVHSLVQSLIDD